MKRPIVRLSPDTPKLHIHIAEVGCDGRTLASECVIRIYPVVCHQPTGCGCGPAPDPIWVEYPVFEIDDDGLLVFYFDDKLWSQPSGRYIGQIVCGGCVVVEVQIELSCNKLYIKSMGITEGVTKC